MVFRHLFCETEERRNESMATPAPAKSQPLHNFALPLWNWSKNQSSNAQTYLRSRKVTVSDSTRRSPSRAPPSKNSLDSENRRYEGVKNGCTVSGSEFVEDLSAADGRSKILMKFRSAKNDKSGDCGVGDEVGRGEDDAVMEDSGMKTWNLRPRRAAGKSNGDARAAPEIKNVSPESARCRSSQPETKTDEKKEKAIKFTIPLTKEAIEEDIFVFTGSKPSRRPRKRPRIQQKHLDNLFPGLWLVSVTPDSYRVSETPKGRS